MPAGDQAHVREQGLLVLRDRGHRHQGQREQGHRGLKKLTATHMLRRVLGNTPGACSSTKLAELSKPEIPSMAAAKPKKSACGTLISIGAERFATGVAGPPRKMKSTPTPRSRSNVAIWVMKMKTATLADSPMPRMVRTMKAASRTMVAGITGSPATASARSASASDAEITAVAM